MDWSIPCFPVHHQLLELAQTCIHRVGDAIRPSHPLSSPYLPAFNLSQHQGLFQWVSSSHKVAIYWCFSFSVSPSYEYSGLISFRVDWLDLLAVQGTLKSLLQYRSSKASILRRSAFFIVQLSHSYMTTGKTIALIFGFSSCYQPEFEFLLHFWHLEISLWFQIRLYSRIIFLSPSALAFHSFGGKGDWFLSA